jgi:hypothetical protein
MDEPERSAVFLAHLEDDGRGQVLSDHLIRASEAARKRSEKIGVGAAGALIGLLHERKDEPGSHPRLPATVGSPSPLRYNTPFHEP